MIIVVIDKGHWNQLKKIVMKIGLINLLLEGWLIESL